MNTDDINPKTHIGATKVPLHLVPPSASHFLALALENGARKYGPYNWREKAVPALTYVAAAKRHLDAYLDGEDLADDSGVHHLAHAMACCAIVLDSLSIGKLIDDRPPPGAASALQLAYSVPKTGTPIPNPGMDPEPGSADAAVLELIPPGTPRNELGD